MNVDISLENPIIEQYETENENGFDKVSEMLRAGIKAAQAGKRSEARHLLLSVTEADADNENAWLWLASISEYPEELLVFLRNVLSINPYNERALEWSKATKSLLAKTFVQRGIDAHKQDQTNFAKQCFLQAIVNDDKNEMAWLWLASITEAVEEKMSHLQKVLRINPDNETAQASLEAAKSQKANNLMRKANAAAVSGRHEEANEILDEVLQSFPDFEDAWILKSYLTNSFDEKLEYFEKVLEINPANETAQTSVNSLRAMKAAVETKEAEQNQILSEEENHAEAAAADYEISQEENHNDYEMSEAESVDFEQAEESFFDEEEDLFAGRIPQPESAFDEIEEEQTETPSLLETQESQHAEEVYTENYGQNEPSEIAEEDAAAQETEKEDFYSESSFEQETAENTESAEERYEFAEETADEHIEEIQYDSAEEVVSFEEIKAESENKYEEFAAPVEEYAEEYQPESEDEEVAMQPEILEETEGFVEQESAEEIAEEETFLSESVESEHAVTSEYNPENIKAETNGNGNGAVHPAEIEQAACPFCRTENEIQAFVCNGCQAILTLSDLEMILAHKDADVEMLRGAVERMEVEQLQRGFDADELTLLGIGYINLKNLRNGMTCLQKALKLEPNNILLNSQVHSLAIRLAEIQQQEDIHRSMPQDRTIMVVDDSATVRKLISGKLEKSGHTVISAVDGVDALEKLEEVVPDLVLLDITMPRMDGYQVCKMIRNNPLMKDVPVVMISGKDGFFDKVRGRMAGTTGYITKPFGPETLMKTVEEFVAQRPESLSEETVNV